MFQDEGLYQNFGHFTEKINRNVDTPLRPPNNRNFKTQSNFRNKMLEKNKVQRRKLFRKSNLESVDETPENSPSNVYHFDAKAVDLVKVNEELLTFKNTCSSNSKLLTGLLDFNSGNIPSPNDEYQTISAIYDVDTSDANLEDAPEDYRLESRWPAAAVHYASKARTSVLNKEYNLQEVDQTLPSNLQAQDGRLCQSPFYSFGKTKNCEKRKPNLQEVGEMPLNLQVQDGSIGQSSFYSFVKAKNCQKRKPNLKEVGEIPSKLRVQDGSLGQSPLCSFVKTKKNFNKLSMPSEGPSFLNSSCSTSTFVPKTTSTPFEVATGVKRVDIKRNQKKKLLDCGTQTEVDYNQRENIVDDDYVLFETPKKKRATFLGDSIEFVHLKNQKTYRRNLGKKSKTDIAFEEYLKNEFEEIANYKLIVES